MNNEIVEINEIPDFSVYKKLRKTTEKLKKKYTTTREIDESKINCFSNGWRRVVSSVVSVLLVLVVIFSLLLCFTSIYGRVQKTVPTFGGFSFMQVVTGSMTAETFEYDDQIYESGHKKGDNIVIRSVDPTTLKVGDKIAFYVYARSFNEFYENERVKITDMSETTKYSTSVSKFFGFQSKVVTEASKTNCKLVFHHIIEVYEVDGHRWFKTQGSSNESRDAWVIKDDYVIGIYDNSKTGKVVSLVLGFITSTGGGIVMLILPLILLASLIMFETFKNAERAKLELDCIEEKRKITDPICVRNKIGYGMSKKVKYKILAQAENSDWNHYIYLLWPNGKAPRAIKKYALRKNLLLRPIELRLSLHRSCESLFKEGEKPEKIAKFYLESEEKIKQYEKRINKKLKAIHKGKKNDKKI